MSAHRIDRINEEIKRELSALLRELKDPRIPPMISLVGVKTTPDLKFCKVYISCLDEEQTGQAQKALKSAAGFIRHEMGNRVNLRCMPQFIFEADHSIANGARMSRMIDQLVGREQAEEGTDATGN